MRLYFRAALFAAVLSLFTFTAVAASDAIWLGPGATDIERQAALELQRLIYAANGRVLEITEAPTVDRGSGYVLGTEQSLPALGIAWPFGMTIPEGDGYLLRSVADASRMLVIVAAPTPQGVQNGVFGLLEELGFGFSLAGDQIPESAPDAADVARRGLSVSKSPAFQVRGFLPWHRYFCGPAAWDLPDYRAYIDQLVHMRCNYVAFHASDSTPFAAYEFEGKLIGGEPLPNTSKPVWGIRPTATDHFLAGTGRYFDKPFFGCEASFIADRAQSIAASKKVLRDALAYAKARGLKTGLGFEIPGDPFNTQTQARFEARVKSLLADYPMLDCLWIWQPEGFGLTPPESPRPRSHWASYARRFDEAFANIEEPDRRAEAVRVAAFAMHAARLLEAFRPDVRLVLSGWGGDAWLRYTDFLPGLDKILPPSVILAGLDAMPVRPDISTGFGAARAARNRWPVLWLEHDGDLMMPQPVLDAVAGAARDAGRKACQGLLGVHWRTREAEEAAGYCASFAWEPTLTKEAYLVRRARTIAGPKAADSLAAVFTKLEAQGYRWIGGAGQSESVPFAWTLGDPAKIESLTAMSAELANTAQEMQSASQEVFRDVSRVEAQITGAILPLRKGPLGLVLHGLGLTHAASAELNYAQDLLGAMHYVLAYDKAAGLLMPGAEWDELAEQGDAAKLLEYARAAGLSDALTIYARRMRTKGEMGVVATLNAKAWADIRARGKLNEQACAALEALPEDSPPDLLVLPDKIAVSGTEPGKARLRLKTRPIGTSKWSTTRLEPAPKTSVYPLVMPTCDQPAAYEYALDLRGPKRVQLRWPLNAHDRGRTALCLPIPQLTAPAPLPSMPPATPRVQHAVAPERGAVQLTWDARPGEIYTVAREGKYIGTVTDGWIEDLAPAGGRNVQYEVLARNLATGEKTAAIALVPVPELPLPKPPAKMTATARGNRIVVAWESDAENAVRYYMQKFDDKDKVIEESYVDADYGHFLQVSDQVDPGRAYAYTVVGIAPDGRMGPPSEKVHVVSSTDPLTPLLHLSFKDKSFLAGLATLSERGLALGGKGWAELPPQPEWDPGHALTLCVWVRLNDLSGSPVLMCKGSWQRAGYFLQVQNKQMRFYLAGVDTLDAGKLDAGQWQHVAATYGFGEMRLYINGKLEGRKRVAGRPRASDEPLLIGRYGAGDDAYFVRGTMDEVRIYNVPLSADEITALYNSTKP